MSCKKPSRNKKYSGRRHPIKLVKAKRNLRKARRRGAATKVRKAKR